MDRNGSHVPPCKTLTAMPNESVSQLGDRAIEFIFLRSIILEVIVYFWRPCARSICSIIPHYMWSNA